MQQKRTELLLILRDEAGVYYFKPDLGTPEIRRLSLEAINVPRGQGVAQCVKIAKRRNINIQEKNVHRLKQFPATRTVRSWYGLGPKKAVTVFVRPFLVDFNGVLPRVFGLVEFDQQAEFHDQVWLPNRCRIAA